MNILGRIPGWLGLAEGRQAKGPAPQGDVGTTGTPFFAGYLRDLGEYNPTLEGLSAFATYEKMRRSDAQVAATLMSMKLPIRSAEWTVTAPENPTPVEQEAADLVRECLLEEIKFDSVIRNALLMLDFGCAAHADHWYVDGNRVRIKKLKPLLPVTFQRWITDDEENLAGIEQYGAKGQSYITATVPADRLALFSHEIEGANFAGRSMLRACYQHWYIKSNLYKIDAISCERNGMGVPYIIMGEDAKKEDRETALAYVTQLSTHEKAGIVLPNGWVFGLKGVEGTLRDPKESISHHNMMIAMAALAQFMMLGQSSGGNRALGESLGDFFYLGLQATAKAISEELSRTTIRRLCDYNFAGLKRYPKIVAQKIQGIEFGTLYAALKEFAGAGLVQGDDELEAYLRKTMGLPEAGKTARKRPEPVAPVTPQAKAPAPQQKLQASAAEMKRQPGTVGSEGARRAEKCVALAAIVGELDRGRDEIAAALRRARARVQKEVVNKLVNTPVRNLHRVSIAPDVKLLAEVEAVLRGVYEFGVGQVAEERTRQVPATAGILRAADLRSPLGIYADGVVGEFVNNLVARAANVALDWMRRPGDATKGETILAIEGELDGQSDKWMDGVASKGTNEAFAEGRADGYEEHKDEIQSVIYSALLDMNTCEQCAAADGEEGATPGDIADVPNPDCDGGDKCRCVHVYVFSDEVRQ